MEKVYIPTEEDFKRWIKEAVQECVAGILKDHRDPFTDEGLLNRKEAATLLRISLVTLTDWVKRGLPCHKQRGKVYFTRSEIMAYLKENHLIRLKFSERFSGLDPS